MMLYYKIHLQAQVNFIFYSFITNSNVLSVFYVLYILKQYKIFWLSDTQHYLVFGLSGL